MRYIKIDSYFVEEGRVYFCDLYINPFQIESFHETEISYTTDVGEAGMRGTTHIRTKSGEEHDIDMPIEQFAMLMES